MYSYDRTAADEGPSEYDQAISTLEKELEALKGHGWWKAPHNYVVNSALMGFNGWIFTILPFRAKLTAYRPAGRLPEGIVIDPSWRPDPRTDRPLDHTPKAAELLIRIVNQSESVPDTVRGELAAIEATFKIQIPSGIQSNLVSESLKVAKRRWGVDRLRQKRILVPLDGSKPIQLGSWD